MDGITKLKTGDFNDLDQVEQPDGSLVIRLMKRGDPDVYTIGVRDLYKPSEAVEWQVVLKPGRV
jgi:hypothetical protein